MERRRHALGDSRLDAEDVLEQSLDRLRPTLSEEEVRDLVAFVRDGLLAPRARPERLRGIIPEKLPSGRTPLTFQFP